MSLINIGELNMTASLQRFIDGDSGKNEMRQTKYNYGDAELIKCHKEQKQIFTRNGDNGTVVMLDAFLYFVLPDTNINVKDKIDGLDIHKVDKIYDFDGTLDHLEVYGYI